MKRLIRASKESRIQQLIQEHNGTKARIESLNKIKWNIDVEDAELLIRQLRFKGDDFIIQIDYPDEQQAKRAEDKGATNCFVFTYADGRKSLWGNRTNDDRALYYYGKA